MAVCYFLKLLMELSFFIIAANCALSITLVGVENIFTIIGIALIGTIGFVLEEKCSKVRFILLPFLLVPIVVGGQTFGTYLTIALASLYVGMIIIKQMYSLEYSTQAETFRIALIIVTGLSIIFVLILRIDYIIPFILLFLLSGIFLLRLLRQDSLILKSIKYQILNFTIILGILLVVLLISSETSINLLNTIVREIYDAIVVPIFYLVYTFGYSIYYFIYFILFSGKEIDPDSELVKELRARQEEVLERTEVTEEVYVESPYLMLIRGVVAALGIVLVLWWLTKSQKRKHNNSDQNVKEYYSYLKTNNKEEKVPVDILPPHEPRAAIRYYYRRFLYLYKDFGGSMSLHYTSQHILHNASRWFDTFKLDQIRTIYIKARYSSHQIKQSDVTTIRRYVKQLQEEQVSKK